MSIDVSRTFSVRAQVILGVVCGLLEVLVNFLQEHFNPVPIFMDTLLTITASFFGGISGALSAVIFRVLAKVLHNQTPFAFFWLVCSLSLVAIIRLFVRARRELSAMDIVLLSFMASIIISVEGAFVFSLLHVIADYREDPSVRQMYLFLKSNGIPLFISALLPRVPMNLLDKGICVPLGFLLYVVARRIIPERSAREE